MNSFSPRCHWPLASPWVSALRSTSTASPEEPDPPESSPERPPDSPSPKGASTQGSNAHTAQPHNLAAPKEDHINSATSFQHRPSSHPMDGVTPSHPPPIQTRCTAPRGSNIFLEPDTMSRSPLPSSEPSAAEGHLLAGESGACFSKQNTGFGHKSQSSHIRSVAMNRLHEGREL